MASGPSIVPEQGGIAYLVLDDLGELGRVWRETEEEADRETLVKQLLSGEYSNPVKIITFDAREGWVRDVSREIADELRRRGHGDTAPALDDFLARYRSHLQVRPAD